jgi:hypothetical protein
VNACADCACTRTVLHMLWSAVGVMSEDASHASPTGKKATDSQKLAAAEETSTAAGATVGKQQRGCSVAVGKAVAPDPIAAEGAPGADAPACTAPTTVAAIAGVQHRLLVACFFSRYLVDNQSRCYNLKRLLIQCTSCKRFCCAQTV